MNLRGWGEIVFTIAITVALAVPLGAYLARVWQGQSTWLDPVLRPVEGALYWTFGVDPKKSQNWFGYAMSLLAFSVASFVVLYLILRFQDLLPFNPQHFAGMAPDLAFNTSISFVTNTNWQSYTAESDALGLLRRWPGLPATTSSRPPPASPWRRRVARAFAANRGEGLGNFWVDLTRISLYVLLPLSIVIAARLRGAWRAADPDRPRRHGRPSKAPSRPTSSSRPPARRRSSSSAPTAAASSTPTRPTRSRTPTRSPT